jgi:hypothetical protein
MAGQGCMAFQRGNTILQRVEELIDPISEQWDEQLLAQTFWDDDASLIKADVVGWHYDSKGCFSVRSAYKVHRAAENRKKSGAFFEPGTSPFPLLRMEIQHF